MVMCVYLASLSLPFRKVVLLEGEDGNVHLKNLSLHPATNEEEGKNIHQCMYDRVITLPAFCSSTKLAFLRGHQQNDGRGVLLLLLFFCGCGTFIFVAVVV